MAEIVQVISKLSVDASEIYSELDKVNAKYGENTEALRKQKEELAKLQREEAGLLKARAQTSNPTIIAQFNKELEKTKTEMDKITKSMVDTQKTLKENSKESGQLKNNLDKAFDGTKVNSLRTQLRNLKEQIAKTDDDEEFLTLSIEAGKLEDKLQDAADAARIFATDSKFEAVGNALGNIGSKLLNLDFDGALQGSQALLRASSQITFKDAIAGIKQIGGTLFNVGKALLTNPLFLLGAAIIAIISNFEKLKNSGGAVGKIFGFIGDIIDGVIQGFNDLTDAIGLTDNAAAEAAENIQKYYDEVYAATEKQYDRLINLQKARGEDEFKAEFNKLVKLRLLNDEQYRAYRDNLVRQGKALDELSEDELKKIKEFGDRESDLANQQQALVLAKDKEFRDKRAKDAKEAEEKRLAAAKKLRDLETQNITDEFARQRAAATNKYNDEFKLASGNKDLIAELRRQLDNELATIDLEEKERNENLLKEKINRSKTFADLEIENLELITNGEFNSTSARLASTINYYEGLISLTKENSEERKLLEKQLQVELEKISKEGQKEAYARLDDDLSEQQRHAAAMLNLQIKDKKELQAALIALEIAFEKRRLQNLENSGVATESEIQKQKNKILELEAQYNAEVEEMDAERTQRIIDNINTVVQSVIDATSEILASEQKRVDELISIQEKRVAAAEKIAENGNARLLELERERLDKLNKEKEKYVRAQQALATAELIANTAVTVSKAAAQGGVAAAVTIAAALIALIAGLASARSIAGQAAFFSGGESDGYTGDGNIHEESTKIGRKPYTYHKKEFIFNNEKTTKYLDIFRKTHKGEIDLNQIKFESDMYKALKARGIDTSRDVVMQTIPNINHDLSELKSSMREVVEAINGQERVRVNIDDKGIDAIASKYIRNRKRINSIT